MTDTIELRRDFAKLRDQLAALITISKDGEGAAGGPDASDVHVPEPLGAKGKKLQERLKALHDRLDKARWPAGTPNSKGGQFAPKGQAGGTGAASQPHGLAGNTFHESGWPGSGQWSKPKEPPKGAKPHPQVNDKGEPVTINYPTKPSGPESWGDATKVATFVPGGDVPKALNGVPFRAWTPPADEGGWATVSGQNAKIEEDSFEPVKGKSVGTGVIVVEPDGRVWLTKPTNEFGGYQHTFPKGTLEPHLPMQANAIKEAYEETGLKVEITGVFGDFERTTSKARYYIARRTGGTPKDMGWESQALRLAPVSSLKNLLNMPVDKGIVDEIKAELEIGGSLHKAKSLAFRAKVLLAKAGAPKAPGKGAWAQQPRWPGGTPLGGQWKAYDADGMTMPPKLGSAANPAPGKKVAALYAAAKSGDVKVLQDYIAANQGKADAFSAAGGKVNTQAKWAAGVHQYAAELSGQLAAKPKAEASAAKVSGPEKLSAWKQTGSKPGGSNPGAIYDDGKGGSWLVKGNKQLVAGAVTQAVSDDRAKNEVLAAKLLAATGTGTVEMKLVDLEGKHGGGLGVAGQMLSGHKSFDPTNQAHLAAIQKDFAVHAWLANYDVLGMGFDNTVIKDGKAVNIDPGGAILFRAQGLPKDSFSAKADEWDSMRTTTTEQKGVFGKMTASQLQESAKALQAIDDATIKQLVDAHGPGDAAAKAKLADTLIARRDDILERAGLKNAPAAAAPAAPAPASEPAPAAAIAAAGQAKSMALLAAKGGAIAAGFSTTNHPTKGLLLAGNQEGMPKTYANKTQAEAAAAKLAAAGVKAQVIGLHPFMVQLTGVARDPGVAAPAHAAPAPAPAAAQSVAKPAIDKPSFNSGLKSDAYYGKTADKAAALHAAGDLAGLKAMANAQKNPGTWGGKTASSQKLVAYHAKLLADLEQKDAQATATQVQAAQAQIAKPARVAQAQAVAEAKQQAALPLPDFEKAKLPAGNVNAASHNGKVDKIAALAAAGDVKGLVSLGYGTNTYGKKQAQLANDALAAMGSELKVAAGQKPNTHPALTGGVPPAKADAALASVGAPALKPHKATKEPVDTSKLNTSGKSLPPVPAFGKSSKAWVNQQNVDLANQIKALFHAGNLDELRHLTYDKLDKDTGAVVGKAHISDHPAKDLQAFYGAAVAVMDEVVNPPRPLKQFSATKAGSLAEIAKAFPGKPFGTTVTKAKSNEKLGYWMALGKVSDPAQFMPPKLSHVSAADKAKAYEDYKSANKLTKAFINGIQASGSYNDLFRSGKKQDHAGNDLKEVAKAATAYAQTKPAGTVVNRWQHMPDEMIEKLFQAGPGTIYQDAGSACTSMSDTATSHFGPHRVRIVYAPGAKAVDSFGSGSFAGEQEITYLPGSRFMIQEIKKVPNDNKSYPSLKERVELVVLMLPPVDL